MDFFTMPLAASPWPIQVLVNLGMAYAAYKIAWHFIVAQAKSVDLNYKNDVWDKLKDSPMAVAVSRLGVYAIACVIIYVAFGGFK